jgi:hypothetical protein
MRTLLFTAVLAFTLSAQAALVAPFVGQHEVARRDHYLITSNIAASMSSTGGVTISAAHSIADLVSKTNIANTNATIQTQLAGKVDENGGAITNGNAWASFSVNSGELKIGSSGDGRMFYDSSADAYLMSNVFHQTRLSLSDNLHLPIGYFALGTSADGRMYYNAADDSFVFTNVFRSTSLRVGDYIYANTYLVPNASSSYDLGTTALWWRNLYLSNNAVIGNNGNIYFGGRGRINSGVDGLLSFWHNDGTTGATGKFGGIIVSTVASNDAAPSAIGAMPDGTLVRIAKGTAGAQTPWGQEINAAGYDLINGGTFVTEWQYTGGITNTGQTYLTGIDSNANAFTASVGLDAAGKLRAGPPDLALNFGSGTRAVTNGNDVTLEVSLQVSNTLWFLSNIVVVANVTNATSGDVTNTISLAPGEIEEIAYETNATVRNTNFSGYVANTKSKWARYILTGPSAITATFNTGAVHGLYWGRNSNNVVDASMTLAANSRYLYSGSRWGSNILQSLIKVDQ